MPVHNNEVGIDGVHHINVMSNAVTQLGRMLSNFAHIPFEHPEFGHFASVEGFWYWLGAGRNSDNDEMRRLYGHRAKHVGRTLEVIPMNDEEFQEQIRIAIRAKIFSDPSLLRMFTLSTLPFRHYLVFAAKTPQGKPHIVEQERHRWQMDYLERLRAELKAMLYHK